MFQSFLSKIMAWLYPAKNHSLGVNSFDDHWYDDDDYADMNDFDLYYQCNHIDQPVIPSNRSTLWALIDAANEVRGIYSPTEVEAIFLRVVSKNRLYTNGDEIFSVMEL